MLITIKSFNGHTLNDASYDTTLLNQHASTGAGTVFIDQAEADSMDAGTYTVAKQTKTLSIKIKNYATRYALLAQMKTWFKRGTRGVLVGTFSDDGVDYQLDCRVTNLIPDPDFGHHFTVLLETGNSTWRAVSETVESAWVVTGTSETQTIAVAGKDETYLSLRVTATGGSGTGYLYQDLYRLPNTPGLEHGVIAWRITVNTAALVAAGKMQADCDDLRIVDLNTGRELRRWIDNPNNANTGVWVVLDLKKGFSLTLLTEVASSGDITTLQFAVTPDMKAKIAEMPRSGIVYHGNEWFAYSNTDSVNCRLTISGSRGLFGTTAETHAAGVTFYYIQHPLVMKYGNSTVTSPTLTDANYDQTKPLIKLTSTNTSWIWDATTLFRDASKPSRPCAWSFFEKMTMLYVGAYGKSVHGVSGVYEVKQDAETGDPALGMMVATNQVGSLWKADNVTLSNTFFRAAEITSVSMTIGKYRTNGNWLALAAIQRSANDVLYETVAAVTTPSAINTYETQTVSSVSVTGAAKYLRLAFIGAYAAAVNAKAYLEGLTCTLGFNSANIPTGAFLGEAVALPISEMAIENITDADYSDGVTVEHVMMINKALVVNGELNTVKYDGVNCHSALTPDDLSRSAFIRLKGGVTNTIKISSAADMGTLSVVMSYYRRRL